MICGGRAAIAIAAAAALTTLAVQSTAAGDAAAAPSAAISPPASSAAPFVATSGRVGDSPETPTLGSLAAREVGGAADGQPGHSGATARPARSAPA